MPAPTPESIAHKLRPALTTLYVTYFRVSGQSDITGPQMSILMRLNDIGDARISQLASYEGIRMPTASNAIHQLEQRGLVERVRDEKDRRVVLVGITDHGRSELQRVGKERDIAVADLVRTLDEEDMPEADRGVDLIVKIAERYGAQFGLKS